MPSALAIAAHPDDIEFQMAGTLLRLQAAGWTIHCFNLSAGDCGSMTDGPAATARNRRREARAAAAALGAVWHAPIARDLRIACTTPMLRRVLAVVRTAKPSIVLTHPPADYMEDHTETCRLAVTATFSRGMPNFKSTPPKPPCPGPCVVYHGMPHGLKGPLREHVQPDLFVDITDVLETKKAALAQHASQREWLDASQGMGSYVQEMAAMSAEVGKMSGRFKYAEAWRRRLHLGFAGPADDPLADALSPKHIVKRG
jgi:N-acetylglucosamine malate deacetylase 1